MPNGLPAADGGCGTRHPSHVSHPCGYLAYVVSYAGDAAVATRDTVSPLVRASSLPLAIRHSQHGLRSLCSLSALRAVGYSQERIDLPPGATSVWHVLKHVANATIQGGTYRVERVKIDATASIVNQFINRGVCQPCTKLNGCLGKAPGLE